MRTCNVQGARCNVRCLVHACGLHQPALRTVHFALRTLHSALRTLHSALRTLHSALCTLHYMAMSMGMAMMAVPSGGSG